MKKLMTVAVASAVAFLAIGAVNGDPALPTGTSFEERDCTNLTWNALVGRADDGVSIGNLYWYASPSDFTEEMGVISNYNGDAYAGTRPDKFAAATQNNFLSIETSTPLFRTVYPYNGEGGTQQVAIATGEGLYLDTLVKFTAADAAFGTNSLDNADKIAISYVAYEPEHPEDVNDVAYTNFVICAGYIGANGISQTNYLATITNGTVDLADWHRLTVRTLTNIDGHDRVGFKVYVDEKELVYLTDDPRFATAAGAEFADATRTIFPSVIDTDRNNYNTISSVAFSGNGSIDDLSFTSTTPQFIKNTESVVATITLGTGISSVEVSVSGTPVAPVESGVNPLVFNLAPGTTDFTLAVTADTANGYTFDDATGIAAENASYANGTVTISGGAPTLTLKATRSNVSYIDDNDDLVACVTLSEAFANVKDGGTIKLAYDFTVATDETTVGEQAKYDLDPDKEIVLDLNGNTLNGGSGEVELFYLASGKMTVIDSVGGGKIIYEGLSVFGTEAELYVGATTGDNGVTIDGVLFTGGAEGYIVRGNVLASVNTTADAFDWAGCLGDGVSVVSTAALSGDYWVVAPQGGSTTFALTTTGGANATVTTSPANVSALTEETEVTITSTPETGYTYNGVDLTDTGFTYDSESDTISKTLTVTADTEVAVPGAVSGQSSEDWPEGQDLDDVAGKAAGDQFPGITNALATADAKAVATWAEAKGVAYADKGGILPEAFLLNCANTQAAIDEAAANFKVTAITVVGDTVTITPADGANYGNGKVVIEGTATLSPISWHEKTDGDHFFRATLVVKPVVAAP